MAAILIASDPESGVLALVANAWAGFGAAFGPLIILSLTWKRMTGAGAVAGLVTGAAVVIAWIALGWNGEFLGGPGVYEIIPGFARRMVGDLAGEQGDGQGCGRNRHFARNAIGNWPRTAAKLRRRDSV